MLKSHLSLVLVALLVHMASAAPAFAKSNSEKKVAFGQKVRANVLKLGLGPEALVKIKLRDKTKLEGYIKEAGTDTFVVANAQTGTSATIAYQDVKTIQGNNYSTGAKIAIGVGIFVAVAAAIILIVRESRTLGVDH